jgi:hypothetical protein
VSEITVWVTGERDPLWVVVDREPSAAQLANGDPGVTIDEALVARYETAWDELVAAHGALEEAIGSW